jgi:hypothetical protein
MRRDIIFGTVAGLTIGIIAYLSSRQKPTVAPASPIIQIDPAIYKMPNPNYKQPTVVVDDSIVKPAKKVRFYDAPYENDDFGLDSLRNNDSIDPDTYLNMPLESDGITYKTRDKYMGIEDTDDKIQSSYKYIKFTVLKVRGDDSTVSIGGIQFLKDGIALRNISVWNPHTGDVNQYYNEEWSDSDQWVVVFVFSEPVMIDEYEIKTSGNTPEMDPVNWKIEGSQNASFWFEIDRKFGDLSYDRNNVVRFSIARTR